MDKRTALAPCAAVAIGLVVGLILAILTIPDLSAVGP